MKVFVATPAYDGRVTIEYAGSLLQAFNLLCAHGIQPHWETLAGCCYLPVARNKLVREFLKSDCTDLLFIDADVGFEPIAPMQLLSWDKDIVGGAVPYRADPLAYPAHPVCVDNRMVTDENGLVETSMLATAFMRIRRRVFEKMIAFADEQAKLGKFQGLTVVERLANGNETDRYLNIFDCQQVGDRWWGEDARFCQLWRDMGGTVWIDPNLQFTHTGSKTWTGTYAEYLRRYGVGGENEFDIRAA